jgi:eukaryotic-like serine/threonine-protein kinase
MEKPEQWQRIKEIVAAALERTPDQRLPFVSEACGDDQSIRLEVESLLSAYESSVGLSESEFTTQLVDAAQMSRSLGPYRLLQKLGEGGMGQVWLAEQLAPVRRKVALKVVRAGMYDDSVLRRFHAERQLLAIMDHPAIAKVFDAGTTPEGQPYFVMEYVAGTAITDYCDRQRLTIHERLELFLRACEGVQHAHQKAIIHRDLKPANILVVEIDGKPVPRIIDFGLAKPLTPYFPGESFHTKIGGFVGTPGYMSLEQADPAVQDVDTRTDVYSLGVILYELLTGFLPFDTAKWKMQRLEEILRHLREDDPVRPSTKVSSDHETSTSRAQARRIDPGQLVSLLRGDLDWITIKALDKDRDRRYGSVSELAADIARYINNEPVLARPASPGYRLRKYVRRHRAAVSVAAGVFLLLIGFAVLQAVQIRRITRERDRANRIADFMTNIFRVSDPSEARGNSVTAREILDKASQDIDTGLAKDPDLQTQMMNFMGTVYETLGLYSTAESLHQRAGEIRRQILGPENPDTLMSEQQLAWDLAGQGRYVEAEKLTRTVLDAERKVLGPDDPRTLDAMYNLGWIIHLEGRLSEAEQLDRETADRRRRVLGPQHPRTLSSLANVAVDLQGQGKYAEAVTIQRQVLATQQRYSGRDAPDTLHTMTNLASSLDKEHEYAEANQVYQDALDTERRVLGPEHPKTLATMTDLALTEYHQGRYVDAEKLYLQTLQIERRVLGAEHPNVVKVMMGLSGTLMGERKFSQAADLSRQAAEVQARTLGPEHPAVLESLKVLASALSQAGQSAEADATIRKIIDIDRRVLGPENRETLDAMNELAGILTDQRRFAEADKLYQDTLATELRLLGPDDPWTATTRYNLACNAARAGQSDKALSILREAVKHKMPLRFVRDLDKDTDLRSLWADARFRALVADARQRAVAGQKQKP